MFAHSNAWRVRVRAWQPPLPPAVRESGAPEALISAPLFLCVLDVRARSFLASSLFCFIIIIIFGFLPTRSPLLPKTSETEHTERERDREVDRWREGGSFWLCARKQAKRKREEKAKSQARRGNKVYVCERVISCLFYRPPPPPLPPDLSLGSRAVYRHAARAIGGT